MRWKSEVDWLFWLPLEKIIYVNNDVNNTHNYKVFATRKEPRGEGKNTTEENLQYLGSLTSDFD